ncbi:MAG: hypothetical protein K0S32_1790 [Bacteroidetes bacterium]|jgi:hypothetical protein|nr:hypothetical protein [Bacteroidota bacterium]
MQSKCNIAGIAGVERNTGSIRDWLMRLSVFNIS